MKNQFRKEVFKRAYQIVKNTGCRFSEALTESWRLYRLSKAMREKPVAFVYKTKSGFEREAVGTLTEASANDTNYSVFIYYDVQKEGFRSFRSENYIGLAA